MMRPIGVGLAGALLAAALPAAAASAVRAGAPALPHVLTCAGTAVLRPARYVLSCADANSYFEKMHWTSWGRATARGAGIFVRNTCTPTCAQGRFVRHPATLVLATPEKTKYGLLFSVVRYQYTVSSSSRLPLAPAATAACAVAPMLAALQRAYGPKVRVVYNGHLVCAGNLAEIAVLIANRASATPGYSGPVGSPHGALMHAVNGAWHEVDLAKPNPYCTADGRQTAAVPAALGRVCGIQ